MTISCQILILSIVSWLIIQSCDAGQICASCSGIADPDDCDHHIKCNDDEKCYINQYTTDSGPAFYELGCISSQACYHSQEAIVGKRAAGHHFKCLSCCNDTVLCNQNFVCGGAAKADAGRTCAFCSSVTSPDDCQHHIKCDHDEKCYIYKYTTESGPAFYDLGCISSQVCPSSHESISGKRDEGHHFKCMSCCNDTNLCNQRLTCGGIPNTGIARDCSDLIISDRRNGTYTIYPYGAHNISVSVYCQFDTDGTWTVIQRRYNGYVDFYRGWDDYKRGFGTANGEYWLGNDVIHEITSHSHYELKIVMTDFQNETRVAEYGLFRLDDEANGYNFTKGSYSGDAGDSLVSHDTMKFTTFDRNNDGSSRNDAVEFHGAWWYLPGYNSNLNGRYFHDGRAPNQDGVTWSTWHGTYQSLKSTTMMIKKK